MYSPNIERSVNTLIFRLVVFVFPVFFLMSFVQAETITRQPPTTTSIPVTPDISSGSCPSDIDLVKLPNHISICGTVKTIDLNNKDGVQYTSEPIKGVTVALYLGSKYMQGNPAVPSFLKVDPNNTGEVSGKIEGLYTYNISNSTGHWIVAAPRGKGTGGMGFLAFFCGDYLRDLYMVDLSKDIGFMPVSLACGREAQPSYDHPGTNNIPAPPSITYANRTAYTSCEDNGTGDVSDGLPGLETEVNQTTFIPLKAESLDDTRIGARVTREVTGICAIENNMWVIKDEREGDWVFEKDPISTVDDEGNGLTKYLEVPPQGTMVSRRDLEGFTHSSLGYSFQSISSLNCGIGGCYDTSGPAVGESEKLTLNRDSVLRCNELNVSNPFQPLNCYGPGVALAEPGEWEKSYNMQKDVRIFSDGTELGDITQPQYSDIGQLIQEILASLGIIIDPAATATPDLALAALNALMSAEDGNRGFLQGIVDKITDTISTAQDMLIVFNPASNFVERGFALARLVDGGIDKLVETYNYFVNFEKEKERLFALVPGSEAAWNLAEENLSSLHDMIVNYGKFLVDLYHGDITWDDFWKFLQGQGQEVIRIATNTINAFAQISEDIKSRIDDIVQKIAAISEAIERIKALRLTTVSSNFFPYSTVLNYNIPGQMRYKLENRPSNDSYENQPNANDCMSAEGPRLLPSITGYKASWPFKACYAGVFIAQDTYSVQKAIFTTTKNTDLAIESRAQLPKDQKINDPVVQRFLMPNEQVGLEASPVEGSIPSSVANLPKVGKGYWRLGVVNTVCTHGVNDWENIESGDTMKDVDYPVLAIFGAEGELRAKSQ